MKWSKWEKKDHLGNQTYLSLLIGCLGASSDLVLIYVGRSLPRENGRFKALVAGVDPEANCHVPNTCETQPTPLDGAPENTVTSNFG